MQIQRYVIHELKKEARSTEASTVVSDRLGEIDDFANILVEQIHTSFSQSSCLKNTDFADRNDSTFKRSFESYYETNDDDSFYQFSVESIRRLENDIQNENLAKGGFYLYADYLTNGTRFISVVLLRKRDGLNIEMQDGVFKPSTTQNLNIDKLAMGFRFNRKIFADENDDRHYIALIAVQSDKISNYFKDWVAVAEILSDRENTNGLVRLINLIPLPTNEDGELMMGRDEFKREVHNLISASNRKVNLKLLGTVFYGDESENEFIEYANNNDIQMDFEFKGNLQILKKLISIKAKAEGIELMVDFLKLNANDVDVRENMIIIRTPEIVSQVIQQRDNP
jgi:nucleoid-associated protein